MPDVNSILRHAVWACLAAALLGSAARGEPEAWPPALPGLSGGTVTLRSAAFLVAPDAVKEAAAKEGAAPFAVAAETPTVDLACHGGLPDRGRLWSAWGDICVADDGKVYCAIGDHGDDAGGKARAYLYEWDPASRRLRRIVDVNAVVPRERGEPAWSKVHARLDQAADGWIYFTGALNSGERAGQPQFRWSDVVPGGQLYRYDPRTGRSELFASLPPGRVTATSLLDRRRNLWWCNLESGPNALFALDLATGRVACRTPDGSMGLNRNFALARDGGIYFNGSDQRLWRCDPAAGTVAPTASAFGEGRGMRSSTRESSDGFIYGTTYPPPGRLFRYSVARDELVLLGPDFLSGGYTAVCVLSPDEKFLYYLPGAHGNARNIGTPVVQYRIETGERKVIAFLRQAFEEECAYVPGGTYGVALSADGGALYINLNGHPADAFRPPKMRPNGFGLTAFAAVRIPDSERR